MLSSLDVCQERSVRYRRVCLYKEDEDYHILIGEFSPVKFPKRFRFGILLFPGIFIFWLVKMVCFGHQKRWPENLWYWWMNAAWIGLFLCACFFLPKPWGFLHEVPFKTNTVYLWKSRHLEIFIEALYYIQLFVVTFPFQLYISTTFQLFMTVFYLFFFSPSFWRWRISVQDVILGSFSSQPSKSSSQHWSQLWRSWPPPENQPDIGQFPHFSMGHTSTQNLHSMVYLFQPVMISFRPGVYNW